LLAAASGHAGIFDALLVLHVLSAVVGFGSVAISGVYGAIVRHPDRPGSQEETRRYFQSRGWAELLILAVPVFGVAALGFRPSGADFSDVWVIAGLLLWLAAATLLIAVVRPAERTIRLAPPGFSAAPAGRRLMWASIACDVLFVFAFAVMVTQPA
jgi:hypothetical protein